MTIDIKKLEEYQLLKIIEENPELFILMAIFNHAKAELIKENKLL